MLNLNLVPPETKKAIKLKRIYRLTRQVSLILIFFTLFLTIILLIAKIILQINFNKVVEETSLVNRNNQNYNNQVQEINAKLKAIEKIQKGFIPWSYFIENISAFTPAGITYSLVKFDQQNESLKIRGLAKTRHDLLDLKANLEKSEAYQEIDFPIKNILTKENIIFDISAKINFSQISLLTPR